MKKLSLGLLAVVLAVGAAAFTVPDKDVFTNYYWFQTQGDGTVINATSVPPFQAGDPNGCSLNGNGCSKAYDSYTMVGPSNYAPSGTLRISHKP
ncbi:hypothetical protein BH10BAC2_BH10BAC2_18060 [soil metagenome]